MDARRKAVAEVFASYPDELEEEEDEFAMVQALALTSGKSWQDSGELSWQPVPASSCESSLSSIISSPSPISLKTTFPPKRAGRKLRLFPCLLFAVFALLAGLIFTNPFGLGTKTSVPRTKNIEDVVPGDMVMSWDEATGQMAPRRVVRTFRNTSDHLRMVTIQNADGSVQTIPTTDGHPFWVKGQGWIFAGDLQEGDQVHHDNGSLGTVLATRYETHAEGVPVYNFEVEGNHTYYVAEDQESQWILVHNASIGPRGNFPPGRHHFIPVAFGNPIPRGSKNLSPFGRYTHSRIQNALNDFLKGRKLPNGRSLYACKGNPGPAVRRFFSPAERFNALETFYRNYQGGRYYPSYRMELNVVNRRGGLRRF